MDRFGRPLVGLVRRFPISAFLLWFFTVGQAFAFAPLYVDVAVSAQWFINGSTVFGLLLPAVVITWIVDGRDGVRNLGRRIVRVRAPLAVYAVGLMLMPLLTIAMAMAVLGAPDVPASTIAAAVVRALIVGTVLGFILNNLWEEIAWTGFIQARLQARHGALIAAAIAAPLFALQHISLYLGNGPMMAVIILLAATAIMFPYRAVNAWIYNRSSGSLFLVGLVHALGNAVAPGAGFGAGYLRQLYPGDAELVGVLHTVAFAVIGIVLIVVTRGRLGLVTPAMPPRRQRQPDIDPEPAPLS